MFPSGKVCVSAAYGIPLHAAWICAGPQYHMSFRVISAAACGHAAFGPGVTYLHMVSGRPQSFSGFLRKARLRRNMIKCGLARPEGSRRMVHVPGRRVDGFLQIHTMNHMAQEEGQ